jgi:hypothetical protein
VIASGHLLRHTSISRLCETRLMMGRERDPPYSAESNTTLDDEGLLALAASLLFRGALLVCPGPRIEGQNWGFRKRIFADVMGRPVNQCDGSTHFECMRAEITWYAVSFQSLTRVSMPPRAPKRSIWIQQRDDNHVRERHTERARAAQCGGIFPARERVEKGRRQCARPRQVRL